jgi:hypothetical protein
VFPVIVRADQTFQLSFNSSLKVDFQLPICCGNRSIVGWFRDDATDEDDNLASLATLNPELISQAKPLAASRRVAVKVEFHAVKLLPRVDSAVTNLTVASRTVVRFCSKARGGGKVDQRSQAGG